MSCFQIARRHVSLRYVAIAVGMMAVCMSAPGSAAESQAAWPFFAFDNGTGGSKVPFDQQAKMLKDLGYDGIAYSGTQRIPEMLAALDGQGLKMLSIYVGVNVSAKRGQSPYPPGLKTAIEQLKGRDTQIWLFIKGGNSALANRDDQAVAVLREIADMAEKSGLCVAIYPHVGFYAERVENALRLVKKVDRKNVGLCFNLCHFLKLDNEKNLDARLKEAMPHLLTVNINGTDGGQTNAISWGRLIQTLDRGNFDVGRVLKTLQRLDYTGPIGLQCYAIPGDRRDNLTRSMSAWRKLTARAAADPQAAEQYEQ